VPGKFERAEDFAAIMARWMADPGEYRRARDRFLALRYEEDPTILIDELVGLANEVAKVSLTRQVFPPANGNGNGNGNGHGAKTA